MFPRFQLYGVSYRSCIDIFSIYRDPCPRIDHDFYEAIPLPPMGKESYFFLESARKEGREVKGFVISIQEGNRA